jgi:serine/threonine-protein kinase
VTTLRDDVQRALGEAYSIERELGGGGMSIVFVAKDNALGRDVVVKVLPQELAASVSVERFKREIMLSAALQHPHIVPVLSAGQADALPYFIMPFVEGESLRARMARGPLSVRETVSILKDVARALAYAHNRGIIHRDIKPDNVLLSGGSAMVTDFGVAKAISASRERVSLGGRGSSGGTSHWSDGTITTIGTSLGTPAYMAPEQAAADPNTDHRADLYALGVVGYEMLVGAPPFAGRSPQALLAAQLTEMPAPLSTRRYDVPPALAELLMRCLEKDPAKRPRGAADVARALEDPAVLSGEFTSVGSRGAPKRARSNRMLLIAALVAIVAAGAAVVLWRSRVATNAATQTAPGATAVPAAAAKSVVVMPLVTIGGDSSDNYFAEGMTAELTSALAKIPGLRVASRTAAVAARDRYVSVQEIGKALSVTMLLEGTVQRDRGQLRVTARLVNVADGFTIWSEMYQRELKDVFKVQDEISSAIVSALTPELGGPAPVAQAGTNARSGTNDVQAYDLYLRGRFFLQKRGEASLRQALKYYQDASTRDPNFAKAYAGTADVYALLPIYTNLKLDSLLPLGLRAIDRAIALDSSLAEAYASRGNLLSLAWRWAEAEREYRHAIQVDPNYAVAHQWYGELLLLNGRVEEAAAQLKRATELDPLSPVALGSYGIALGVAKRHPEAIAAGRRSLELDSTIAVTRMMVGAINLYAGLVPDAVRELEVADRIEPGNPFVLGVLGYAYAISGQTSRARGIVTRLEADSPQRTSAPAAAARVYLGLKDTARALTLLERAVAQHDVSFSTQVLAEPFFDPIRGSARFASVLDRVGLDRRLQR